MKRATPLATGAFTLVEVLVATSIAGVVAMCMGTFLGGSAILFAKNVSTNLTHNSTRSALDRFSQDITQADGAVSLISAAGAPIATGQAAGIVFDVLRANPYIIAHPGGTGLAASATVLTLQRSTNAVARPPLPVAGDVILADDAASVRLKVLSAVVSTTAGTVQNVSVTLQSPAGTAIPWSAGSLKASAPGAPRGVCRRACGREE